jgi:phage FluMu gp28-like protein
MSNLLLDELSALTEEQLADLANRLGPEGLLGAKAAVEAELIEACKRDGLMFLKFVKTRDEADQNESLKPFPVHLEYIRAVWNVLVNNRKVVVAKSRQMLMSWIMCAFCVWWARFKPHQAVYWQTQKAEDAYEKVAMPTQSGRAGGYMGRCQLIEANLPPFLQQPIRPTEGLIVYPNGSIIQGIPGGADQIRGKVVSVYVGDEFAFQEEARGVYTATAPLIQKGAKFIAVSTPNGGPEASMFAQLFHGVQA